jgi:hypothetical protein
MTARRYRAGATSKPVFMLFLAFAILQVLPGSAFAGSVISREQLSEMRALRDRMKAHPEQMTTEQKQKLLHTFDESLGMIGSTLSAIADPNMREGLAVLADLVKILELDDAKAVALLRKLEALDEWVGQTVALAQLLQPQSAAWRPTGGGRQGSALVTKLSGSDTHTTRPFRVENGWEIQWDYKPSGLFANSGVFQLYLYGEGNVPLDIVANQMQPGSGSAYRPKGGRYYLEVNALGSWEIRVVQVQE